MIFILKMDPFVAGSTEGYTDLTVILFFVIIAGLYAHVKNTGIKNIKTQEKNKNLEQ